MLLFGFHVIKILTYIGKSFRNLKKKKKGKHKIDSKINSTLDCMVHHRNTNDHNLSNMSLIEIFGVTEKWDRRFNK